MRVDTIARGAIVAASVAGFSMLVAAAPASAECKKMYQTATATGTFKGVTGVEARAAWRLAVIAKDGIAYAIWSKSKNRSTNCWNPGTGPKWKCVARAKACA
jgi:hypothetical protein